MLAKRRMGGRNVEKAAAKTAVKAIYLQSAALAGFEVGPESPERFSDIVEDGFAIVQPGRRAEAVANVLRVVAMTLELAEKNKLTRLSESSVDAGKAAVCPVYPFGGKKVTPTGKRAFARKGRIAR